MKGLRGIFINLSLVLLTVGAFPSLVFANTAEEAASGDREDMENFVKMAQEELNNADGIDAVSQFRQDTRNDTTGKWKHDKTYLIQIEESGAVLNHGIHNKDLYGDFIDGFQTVKDLREMLKGKDADSDPVCVANGATYSCAAYYKSPFGIRPNIVIGGFDHAKDDENITKLKCNQAVPSITAKDLHENQEAGADQESLKKDLKIFVREAINWATTLESPGDAAKYEPDILSGVRCFTKDKSPWKHESIYFFVMTQEAFVPVNGADQNLTGSNFKGVRDENGTDIGEKIIEAADDNGKGDFVEYLWDNPVDNIDLLPEAIANGKSPGTEEKISYVEGRVFPKFTGQTNTVFIFGSGVYPKEMKAEEPSTSSGSDDDDDGCAIAAGSGNNPESTLFNLLLMVSGLFLAVSWRKRSVRKA